MRRHDCMLEILCKRAMNVIGILSIDYMRLHSSQLSLPAELVHNCFQGGSLRADLQAQDCGNSSMPIEEMRFLDRKDRHEHS